MLKQVAFDINANGYGETLLKHFGGLDKASASLSKQRYIYGTIVRLPKVKHSATTLNGKILILR